MAGRYKLLVCLVAINICLVNAKCKHATKYNSLTSEPATEEEILSAEESSNPGLCIKEIEECNPHDYSRLDGSCNSLKYPAVGTYNTPFYNMVSPVFGENYTVRTTQDGKPLTPVRKCRTEILGDGEGYHEEFTMLFGYVVNTFYGDFLSIHDELNILSNTTTCCTPEGKDNDLCAPMHVPEDDPVHRFTGLRCMNMTKPLTFQYYGCGNKTSEPIRIGNFTHTMDMSFLYFPTTTSIKEARTYEGGLLKVEEEGGVLWPPNATSNANCRANVKPLETRCSAATNNQNFGTNIVSIWLYRMHNVVASALGAVNPCWSDDKIFNTSRDVMIAMWSQIILYEMMPLILGREHMVKAGIISYDKGWRNIYNENLSPVISTDFVYFGRWFHTMQSGKVRMYDEDGTYVSEIPITNLTQRSGSLVYNKSMARMALGSIIDPCGAADDYVDPIIGDLAFGSLQWSSDIPASDQVRGRYYGIAPYVKYRDYCNPGQAHTTYEDIAPYIRPHKVEPLKRIFSDALDIDAMVGVWAEKLMPGSQCPYTLHCILTEQMYRMVRSDRYFYELKHKPYALTGRQLAAIRNATIAFIMCKAADGITKIQPQAFKLASDSNELVDCADIAQVDFTAWADEACTETTDDCDYTDSTTTDTEDTSDSDTSSTDTNDSSNILLTSLETLLTQIAEIVLPSNTTTSS